MIRSSARRPAARLLPVRLTRRNASHGTPRFAWLFVDSVYPLQLARWDFRHYIGLLRSENLLSRLHDQLSDVHDHGFRVLFLEPQSKDGGVFVRFSYNIDATTSDDAASAPVEHQVLHAIERALNAAVQQRGGVPSWNGRTTGRVWLVQGTPWREDLNRFASPMLNIAFDGPDVQEQALYSLCRPFGKITDISGPGATPPGTLRASTVTFGKLRAAAVARNVVHGLEIAPDINSSGGTGPGSGGANTRTRLRLSYQKPLHAHAVRSWMSGHPKIVLPVLVFLLGTLTYTVFDPVRTFMVEGKMMAWFDVKKFRAYEWLRSHVLEGSEPSFSANEVQDGLSKEENVREIQEKAGVWKERREAEAALAAYLTDTPSTVAFVHGPQGSGKTSLVKETLMEMHRTALVIDCAALNQATSDAQLVGALAAQTGYWPVFTFLNSLNSLIDLASVGLVGQKTGLSHTLTEQLDQILRVVASALKSVADTHRSHAEWRMERQERAKDVRREESRVREMVRRGVWHDGRLDCVAGSGVMCELGIGDEKMDEQWDGGGWREGEVPTSEEPSRNQRERTREEVGSVRNLPIVVIRNYGLKVGVSNREEVLNVLARWAAMLVESQIAHVVVLSDNRENAKRLAKALPMRSLNSILLSDADVASSMSFVKQRLRDGGIDVGFSPQETECVQRLGGRASDLESLIHKVRGGMSVQEAVEDIVSRGVSEVRKNAFGDEGEDGEGLLWKREQAWALLKMLAKETEVPYYDVLQEFPFKGDEGALRSMEHAELVTIGTVDGRPSTIRPGKPMLWWVFKRLVNDRVFQATQDIYLNEMAISKAESKVRECEEELGRLHVAADMEPRRWYARVWGVLGGSRSACGERAAWVAQKMWKAQRKLEVLERRNVELQKALARGG